MTSQTGVTAMKSALVSLQERTSPEAQGSVSPRIYMLNPLLAGPLSDWGPGSTAPPPSASPMC